MKGELIIHSEKNASSSEYTNKYYSKKVAAILETNESDYEDDLADVMEDLDTDFVIEDNEDKHEDQDEEDNSLD